MPKSGTFPFFHLEPIEGFYFEVSNESSKYLVSIIHEEDGYAGNLAFSTDVKSDGFVVLKSAMIEKDFRSRGVFDMALTLMLANIDADLMGYENPQGIKLDEEAGKRSDAYLYWQNLIKEGYTSPTETGDMRHALKKEKSTAVIKHAKMQLE